MGYRSHSIISKFEPELKETVEEMIKSGVYYKDIAKYIRTHGISISVSSVARYGQNLMSTLDALRMSQENFRVIMEETERYPNLDTTEAILRLLSSNMLDAINNMSEEQLKEIDFETLTKNAVALTRAAAYKKNIDIKNKGSLKIGAEQFNAHIFEAMSNEKPELYKALKKFIKTKQGD